MSNYIRRRVPGGTYFFTVNLADPQACLLAVEIDLFRACYAATCQHLPFRTDTIVILPNHLHAIWTLPKGDDNISERWRRIKGRFTHEVREKYPAKSSRPYREPPKVWQPRFWEHTIRDQDDLEQHRAYCWSDPVRHELVHDPMDWPFSSFAKRQHRLTEVGRLEFPKMAFPTGEYDSDRPVGGRIPCATREDAA